MDKQQVINFVVNNDKIEILKAMTNRFNPFKVLKVQDHEIRHSNILAWIFNPSENHNFDDRILKRFLLKVLLSPSNDEILNDMEMVYMIQNTSLSDIKVYRELQNIDIVLLSEKQHLVIYIENKVYSGEHSNQLARYYDYINITYPDYTTIPVFLTLDGHEASHDKYFLASYDDVLETIEFITSNYNDRTSPEVLSFLNYYSIILKEKYVMDAELKNLCKEVYQQNKDVIDMIYSVGNEMDIEPAVSVFKTKYPDIVPISIKNRTFWFGVHSFSIGRIFPLGGWGGGYPVCFWFTDYGKKLKIVLEIGPFADSSTRASFLSELQKAGVKISERAKEPGRKYTKIYTNTHTITDWTDTDELAEAMENLYEKEELKELRSVVEMVVNNFQW